MPGRVERLGQHFLGSDLIAARLVADAGVDAGSRIVDLGAGTGVLTAALAARAATVLAVELDPALAAGLARRFASEPNVTVLRADLRDVPLPVTPYAVVANPPFGRTAAILHRLLDDPGGGLVRADLVVQWQVARHRANTTRANTTAPTPPAPGPATTTQPPSTWSGRSGTRGGGSSAGAAFRRACSGPDRPSTRPSCGSPGATRPAFRPTSSIATPRS